ncbi:probable ubiquitin carboxyl-terminal hydrolase 16 [Lolium rigidum]|uniref:probable ubiquitin carboxyl-terminal hydrolase 16 n=1 Tax=Lolium rigidum TaxID=89674 RepID=UPI001F5D0819|nr:probable ubiquitin carboxyl-terminal hydrolase 16 [Lolium rigidum]
MDGVGEAAATTPSDGFFLLFCPRCCGVVSGAKAEQRGFVQEYVQTMVCTGDSWKMVHLVVGLWLKADGSGSLLRYRRAWVPVLKFDGVSRDMLPWSDSFNGNGLSYGKLHWRSEKLMISDGAASSSGEEQPPNSPDLNVLDLCFFRSLQSLTDTRAPNNIRELIHGVEEEYRNYEVNKLSRSFITLQSCMIRMIKMGSVPSVPLKNLWKNRFKGLDLLELSSHFIPGQQEDAHEFLRCLLDNLHHCTLDPKSKGKPSSFDEESIVKHVFGGRLKSQLTCRECGHCSETFEPFLDLSLEIDQVDDLIVALESFTKVEQIGDLENKLTCERCNVEVCKDKRLMLDKAPDVLTLQLKRFTTLDSSVEKIDKHVSYPSELDLKPFHSNPETEHILMFCLYSQLHQELKYDLYGVVEHSGLPNFGHYVCAIRSSPSSWHLMDDSHVNSITETSALRHEAYVLFYVRQGMFPWFSSLIDEATNTSQQRTSVEDEINNSERPSTRRTSDHDVFAFEKLDEEDTRLMPATEHQRKVKKPKTKSASKSVKGSFVDQSVSRLMMDMPSARRQGFLDCIITQRHEHESYSGPRKLLFSVANVHANSNGENANTPVN